MSTDGGISKEDGAHVQWNATQPYIQWDATQPYQGRKCDLQQHRRTEITVQRRTAHDIHVWDLDSDQVGIFTKQKQTHRHREQNYSY